MRFHQLTHALRQMQEQLHAQKLLITAQQQRQQHQPEKRGFGSVSRAPTAYHQPLQSLAANPHPYGAHSQSEQPGAQSASNYFEDDQLQTLDAFSTRVHEAEDLIDPSLTSPPNLVNKENLELQWNFLMGQQ
jgi:hypothetical protein